MRGRMHKYLLLIVTLGKKSQAHSYEKVTEAKEAEVVQENVGCKATPR